MVPDSCEKVVVLQNGVGDYFGTADTTVIEGDDIPRGEEQTLELETIVDETTARTRILIRFALDETVIGNLSSARLVLYETHRSQDFANKLELYQLIRPFDEETATGEIRQTGEPWTETDDWQDGDIEEQPAASSFDLEPETPSERWIELEVTDVLNGMDIDDNHGWLLRANDEDPSFYISFASAQHDDPNLRPALFLTLLR